MEDGKALRPELLINRKRGHQGDPLKLITLLAFGSERQGDRRATGVG